MNPRFSRPLRTAGSTLFALLLAGLCQVRAESLRANIGELLLQNMQPGQTYDLTRLLNLPLRITYSGFTNSEILFLPHIPTTADEMKKGYEPIPDKSWVTVEPGQMDLSDFGGVAEANVKVTIPDDDQYLGKKYAVYVWSRAHQKGGGITFGLGVKSRLLLVINTERAVDETLNLPAEERASLNFVMEPQEVRIAKPVALGRKHKVAKRAKTKILIKNHDAVERRFHVRSVLGSDYSLTLPEGWTWPPDAGALTFASDVVVVPPNGEAEVEAFLQLPKDASLRGKKFIYAVRVAPEGKGVATGAMSRIFVETRP